MKFLSSIVLVSIFFVAGLHAQQEIDSLRRLAESKTGTEKIDALNALSLRLLLIDYTLAENSIVQALSLSEQIQYPAGLAEATVNKGVLAIFNSNIQPSLDLFNVALEQSRKIKNAAVEGYASTRKANVYRELGNYDSAKFWYDKAYDALKDRPDSWQLSVLYRNLGLYYSMTYKFAAGINSFNRALEIRKKLADRILLLDITILLTDAHLKQFNQPLAEAYLKESQKYCEPGNATAVQNEINYQKAILNFRKNNYKDALNQIDEVKTFYTKHQNPQQYASLLIDLAEALEGMSSYELSLQKGYEALKISEENNLIMPSVRAQLIIGRNYMRLQQVPLALDFANKALAAAHANQFLFLEGAAYNLIGLINHYITPEEALHAYEKALSIRKSVGDKAGMAASLGNIGEYYEERNQFEKALKIQNESQVIADSASHQISMYWAYFNMSKIYYRQKEYEKANYFLVKAENKAKQISYRLASVDIYLLRRNLLMAQGKLQEALRYSLRYEQLKDSLNYNSITGRVLGIQSIYEQDRKDNEITMLNKNKEFQQQQIENQKLRLRNQEVILALGVVAIMLSGIWIYTANRTSKKMKALNKEIQEQNEEIQAQSEELTEANQALLVTNIDLAEKHEELQTQSEELRESHQIISELNDGLERRVEERTQELQQAYKELDTFFYRSSHDFRRPLTTFMGLAEVAKITVKDSNALDLFDKVKETAINLDRMLIKLQSISDVGAQQFIYKELSLKQVFESTLDTYKEALQEKKIKVAIDILTTSCFSCYPAFLKIIIDNLVENSIQFCDRVNPYIKLSAADKNGGVVITIEDNGVGIEAEYMDRIFDMFFRGNEHSKGNGLGLYIVQKAVGKLNGTISLESIIGKGTIATIWIPNGQQIK